MIDGAPRRILRESAIVFIINLFARTGGILGSQPAPTDSRAITAAGLDPYRIVLVGSGIVVGYGLASHALGAGGHLARYISAETRRGVNLDVVPLPSLLIRFAPVQLSRLDLQRYDAVVLAAGVNDAFGITSVEGWRRGLASTLRLLKARLPAARQIFLVVIADPSPSPLFRSGPSRRAAGRGKIFNAESRRLTEGDPDVTVVEFDIGVAASVPRPYDSGSYLGWVRQMGPRIVEGLARIRPFD